MNMSQILDRSFKIMEASFKDNLSLGVVLLLGPSILMGFAFHLCYALMANVAEDAFAGGGSFFNFAGFLAGFAAIMFAGLILMFTHTTAMVAGTSMACGELTGKPMRWQEALSHTIWKRLMRGVGSTILLVLLMLGCILIPEILLIVGIGTRSIPLMSFGGVLFIPAFVLMLRYAVRWSMTIPVIASEDLGVIASIRRSSALVQGTWWRLFGIILAFAIIAGFVMSVVLVPAVLLTMLGPIREYVNLVTSPEMIQADPSAIFRVFSRMGAGIGVLTFLQYMLYLIIVPACASVLMFDLRARKGELQPAPPTETLGT